MAGRDNEPWASKKCSAATGWAEDAVHADKGEMRWRDHARRRLGSTVATMRARIGLGWERRDTGGVERTVLAQKIHKTSHQRQVSEECKRASVQLLGWGGPGRLCVGRMSRQHRQQVSVGSRKLSGQRRGSRQCRERVLQRRRRRCLGWLRQVGGRGGGA